MVCVRTCVCCVATSSSGVPAAVGDMQGAALERHVDKARFDAGAVEMRLGLDEIVVGEDAKADPLAHRLALGLLQRQAVMAAFLDAVQPHRVVGLVADDEAEDFGVEVLARREIARGEYEVAGARDVEGRMWLVCG